MKLEEIFKGGANFDKYVDFCRNQTAFSSGAAKIQNGRYSIKRLKMETGDGFLVVPMMIHLPLSVDGKRLPEPIPYIGSFKTAIRIIKHLCAMDATFAEGLKAVLGDEDFGCIDVNGDVTDEDRRIFRKYRKPLVYARTVMTVKAVDSKYQYGTPYRVNLAVDQETGEYVDDPSNPLIYKLHRLETSCIAALVKQLREENEAMGNSRRTDAEISARIKDMWDGRCISNPYALGTTRVLFIKTTPNYEVIPEVKNGWKAEVKAVKAQEFYIKINRKILEGLEKNIDTKYDRYDDFLLIKQNTPSFDEKTRGTTAQSISRTPAGSDDAIETMLTGFAEAYTEYRDVLEDWGEDIVLKSAFEYRSISDQAITDIFKNYMPVLSSAMKTAEIAEKYSEVIQGLDTQLSDELLASAMTGELPSAGDTTREISEAPIVTENTPGFGGDTAEAEDLTQEFVQALSE